VKTSDLIRNLKLYITLGRRNDPLSLNRYTYGHNNPIKYRDPSGHAAEFIMTLSNGTTWIPAAGGYVDKNGVLVSTTPQYTNGVNFGPNEGADWLRTGSGLSFDEFWGVGTSGSSSGGSSSLGAMSPVSLGTADTGSAQNLSSNTSSSTSSSVNQKSTSAVVTVGKTSIGNTVFIDNSVWGNAIQLAKALGCSVSYDNNGRITIKAGSYYTFSSNMQIDGQYVVPIIEVARGAGYGDTISWWEDGSTYNILIQPDMWNAPIKVTRAGDQINIAAYINFTGDWNVTPSGYSGSLAEVFATGIAEQWGGKKSATSYESFGNYSSVTVNVSVYAKQVTSSGAWMQHNSGNQNYYEVNIINNPGSKNENHVPHMDTSFFGLANWSYTKPGKITMYLRDGRNPDDYSETQFKQVSSHEFGHIMGVGDAYGYPVGASNAIMKKYQYRPVSIANGETETSIMHGWQVANANDVEMVLEAYRTNKWQDFMTFKAPIGYSNGTKSVVIRSY